MSGAAAGLERRAGTARQADAEEEDALQVSARLQGWMPKKKKKPPPPADGGGEQMPEGLTKMEQLKWRKANPGKAPKARKAAAAAQPFACERGASGDLQLRELRPAVSRSLPLFLGTYPAPSRLRGASDRRGARPLSEGSDGEAAD